VAFHHDPILSGFRADALLAALRKTACREKVNARNMMAAALQTAGHAVSEGSLWRASCGSSGRRKEW